MPNQQHLADILEKYSANSSKSPLPDSHGDANTEASTAINSLVLEAILRNLEACLGSNDIETAANVRTRIKELKLAAR
jgi:protein-arginine kinase activator protein McsA